MASPAIDGQAGLSIKDGESDYGSDFSPEEEQIVSRLLSGQPVDIEDNPIVNDIEQNDAQQALRIPRFGREYRSPFFEAARAAEEVAEQISKFVKTGDFYPDCTSCLLFCFDKSD
jgi:exonuclease V